MRVLAIDQGTSGTKALVVDDEAGVVAVAEEEVRPAYLGGGAVEQDPEALLASVRDAGTRALAEAGGAVDVVALANQGETVLAWDPDSGRPHGPAIVWQDSRAEEVCAGLRAAHGEAVAQRTGLVLDPYFSAPKMAWLRRNRTREGVVTTTDTWLLAQLTGEFVTDVATASRSLLLDLDRGDWDPALVEVFGLDGEALPRIVDCDVVVGETDAFGPTVPVGGLIVDQPAALIAEGCLEAGTAKCTYGTGAFLLGNTGGNAVRSEVGLTTSVGWRVRGDLAYYLDGQVYTAASAVRWLTDLGVISGAAELDTVAADDSGGALFVPGLAGLAAPWWKPDATGGLVGLSLSTERPQLVRAVLEGIAAQIADLAHTIAADLGRPLERLRVDGGLTRSRVLMQAQADLLQAPVDVYPSAHATALGVATLGRLALDGRLTLGEAVDDWTPSQTYEPTLSAEAAAERLGQWRAAVEATLAATPS